MVNRVEWVVEITRDFYGEDAACQAVFQTEVEALRCKAGASQERDFIRAAVYSRPKWNIHYAAPLANDDLLP